MSAEHDRLLDPAHLVGLERRPIVEIRALRRACVDYETGLSYLRRLVQGSIDIIEGELHRRSDGEHPSTQDLVDALPGLLTESGGTKGTGGRLTATLEPMEIDDELGREYEELVAGGLVAQAAEAETASLHGALTGLQDVERRVSTKRRAFHDRIDTLQAELTRRYRTGEASVDTLLGTT